MSSLFSFHECHISMYIQGLEVSMDYRTGYMSTNMVLTEQLSDFENERHNMTEAEKEHLLFQKMDEQLKKQHADVKRQSGISHSTRDLFRGPGIG